MAATYAARCQRILVKLPGGERFDNWPLSCPAALLLAGGSPPQLFSDTPPASSRRYSMWGG